MSPLNETDPLWLRLWTWRHRGSTIKDLAPVSRDELKPFGLSEDPWPIPSHVNKPKARIPADVPDMVWEPVRSGSRRVEVFCCGDFFLRVNTPNSPDDKIRTQVDFYQQCGYPAPELVSFGDNWLITRRIPGELPTTCGPWLDEVFREVMKLRDREDLRSCLSVWTPKTSMLSSVLDEKTVEVLEGLAALVPEEEFVSHGDLQANNVIVKDDHLKGIVDFEAVALAPIERDVALWLTTLSGQVGLVPLSNALVNSGITVRPLVLAGCVVHSINKAAASATRRFNPDPYIATVAYLAQWLAENPEGPYRLLFPTD
jgi:hypothetical protein